MRPSSKDAYRQVAEAAWRWGLDQVGWDDGPWIPESVSPGEEAQIPRQRDGSHSGVGGLAYVLAEIRLTRAWTEQETTLAGGIAGRLRHGIPDESDCTFFDGLPSTVGALIALDEPRVEAAFTRLAALAGSDGWPQTVLEPPRYLPAPRRLRGCHLQLVPRPHRHVVPVPRPPPGRRRRRRGREPALLAATLLAQSPHLWRPCPPAARLLDNDGRCCGTAGVGEVFLDSWQRAADGTDLEFAVRLADTLIDRVVREDTNAYWRFVEHRAPEPLLPPGVGWMQGAAGIAAFLFRISRLLNQGPSATAVARLDNWWALPTDMHPNVTAGLR